MESSRLDEWMNGWVDEWMNGNYEKQLCSSQIEAR